MKMSTLLMWILYGVISSTLMTMADIYFGWGLFSWLN